MSATTFQHRHHPENAAWRKPHSRARVRTTEHAVKASALVGENEHRAPQIGFTGRYLDKETGLWYFNARYYSGSLGRFIERDPNMTLPWTEMNKQYKHRLGERRQLVGWMPVSLDGYQDGMLLYAAHFVPNATDPTGMTPCMREDGNSLAGLDCCINKCLMWWSATTVGAWCAIPGLISAVPGSPAKAPYLTTGLFRKVMNRASVCCVGWLAGILIGCEAKCLGTNAGYDGLVP
jgi:RHS repeat-associated protein